MKKIMLVLSVFTLSSLMAAQTAIPAGTVIPLRLDTSIDANHSKPGEKLKARIMQDVPLNNGATLKAGTPVFGEVVEATPASGSSPAAVTLRFNQVEQNGHAVDIATNMRALASPLDVEQAETQISGDERGSGPEWSLNLVQIGGTDAVYRETGKVISAGEPVGTVVYAGGWGVLSKVSADADARCRGAVAGNDTPQALWVFSHDACGIYGYMAEITHAGRANPEGKITIASTSGDLKIRSGSAMLLRVKETAGNESAEK